MSVLAPNKHVRRVRAGGISLPRLVAGDHLDLDEFHQRYEATPEIKKAELIHGIVFMPPPVFEDHAQPDNFAATLIGLFSVRTPGTEAHNDRTLDLIGINEVQPDVCLIIRPECGGKTHVNERRLLAGAPELIFEVAASSANYDLFEKKAVYHANQVQEYLVWQTLDQRLDWLEWTPTDYIRRVPDSKGFIRSRVFPGLWLNVSALLRGRFDAVIDTLKQGIKSAEHSAFVARLAATRKRKR